MCDCNMTGYTESETLDHCNDIDECAEHNGGCDDICINKLGTYECRCDIKGRKLAEDGHSCVDVDECTRYKSKVCSNGKCTNTEGSYTCSCNTGYRQSESGSACEDMDECADSNGGCEQLCQNNAGSYNCACQEGYVINEDKVTCKDVNECQTDNGGCEDTCVNSLGSFICVCTHVGKVLAPDSHSCTGCSRTQYFNRSISACTDCPEHAHARDGLALTVNDCSCDEGFHGSPTREVECQDTNECQTSESVCSHECVNTIGSFYCACPEGLTTDEDGATCIDIDECQQSAHNCSQLCNNTYGSYTCGCQDGFVMDQDGITCTDVNECELGQDGCSDGCTNTEGSYMCGCADGYQLSDNGRMCEDVNECLRDLSPCQHKCLNTEGSYFCECNGAGFKLSRDMSSCIDINECMEGDNPCPDICINTIGSFLCDCDKPGYLLAGDASGCEDINECSEDPNPCPYKCINTPGSFKCSCPVGHAEPPEHNQTLCIECGYGTYRGQNDPDCKRCPPRSNTTSTGMTSIKDCVCIEGYLADPRGTGLCIDINECKTGLLRCEQGCVDLEGSARCVCRPGFRLNKDQTTCDDVNECDQQNGGCEQVCVNTPGSFYCQCEGRKYRLADNGLSCVDVNECKLPDHGCEYKCVNRRGGAKCLCPPGHQLLRDGKKCKDINECRSRNGGCTDKCINTPGSYRCECSNLPGYKLYTDGRQCTDINECEETEDACSDLCVNNVGSYRCYCRRQGFTLGQDKKTCEDIDECLRGRICEQRCINLPGSFRCDCKAGYYKQGHHCTPCPKNSYRAITDSVINCESCPLGMTTASKATESVRGCFCPSGYQGNPELGEACSDVDECLVESLGGLCGQECVNTNGSYHCACESGFVLNPDNKTCTATKCPLLKIPDFAKFSTYECRRMSKGDHVPPGTVCTYRCRGALVLLGPVNRTCLANFTWTGDDSTCRAFPCERLPVPKNGYLYPRKCMLPRIPFRSRCSFRCKKGFKRVGRAGAKCKANTKWSGKSIPKCVPVHKKKNG